MNLYFNVCLIFFTCMINLSHAESFECDNNFNECGTPNQSGGGGGGGGSILIANTDLGDSYQNADDFDDDGIEDPQDNCMRIPNPDQIDRDGDQVGDMCDNCLDTWNPNQENTDGDLLGDVCDDDIDNDNILNELDECPYHYSDYCFLSEIEVSQVIKNLSKPDEVITPEENSRTLKPNTLEKGCSSSISSFRFYFLIILLLLFRKNKKNSV